MYRTDSNVFFLMAEQYSIVYMYHSFLIHSSADGHLCFFHVLTIINSAVMNIGVHVSLSILVSSVCMTSSGIAGSKGNSISSFFKESLHCLLYNIVLVLPYWRIPWTEELGVLQSTGLQRVRHNGATKHTCPEQEEITSEHCKQSECTLTG